MSRPSPTFKTLIVLVMAFLLVVLGRIGYQQFEEASRRRAARNNLRQIQVALDNYRQRHGLAAEDEEHNAERRDSTDVR